MERFAIVGDVFFLAAGTVFFRGRRRASGDFFVIVALAHVVVRIPVAIATESVHFTNIDGPVHPAEQGFSFVVSVTG